jgi:hypothetical protein
MLRPRKRPWLPEDDERLRAFVGKGTSLVRAAAAMKRKMKSVQQRARKIGCPFSPLRIARKKWTDTPEWQQPRY